MLANPQKSMLSQLKGMKVGEVLSFPVAKMSTIKCSCTMFGLQWGMKFSTSVNRKNKTIDVTRKE